MGRLAIGVDIGGTNTKLALVDERGSIQARAAHATPRDARPQAVIEAVVGLVRDFRQSVEAAGLRSEGIGFTVPHFYDGPDWVQRQTNNMPSLEGHPARPALAAAFGESIAMINDLSAAGIAEFAFGRGQGHERMLLMAIGTGVSISVVTRDQGLIHYSWDTAGDAGMIIVDPSAESLCTCGGRGCLESLVSAPALRRRALAEVERGKATQLARRKAERGDLEARDISEAAQAGDAVALDILERAGFYLGVGLTSYLHLFRPDLIVLGGGVAQAGKLLIDPIRRTMERLASPWYLSRLQAIEVSALGQDGQAIGAASLILHPGRYIR